MGCLAGWSLGGGLFGLLIRLLPFSTLSPWENRALCRRRRDIDDGRRDIDDGRRDIDDGRWEIEDGRWEIEDGRWWRNGER
jgi:hypothetical protein